MMQLRDVSPQHSAVSGGAKCPGRFHDPVWLVVPTCDILVGNKRKLFAAGRTSSKPHSEPFESFQLA